MVKEYIKNNKWLQRVLSKPYFYLFYFRNKRTIEKSPETFISSFYKLNFNRDLNLSNPKTFSEKLNWMKLYWYDERALICSDKYTVREYVKSKGLGTILNELYAVYDSPKEIDIRKLPAQFVLKATHDSGHVFICTDKNTFDIKKVKKQLRRILNFDYEYFGGEWPYASNHKKIICEKYLEDKNAGELFDYKFFCFNGKPEMIFFCSDRANRTKSDFYDLDWNLLPFRENFEPSGKVYPKPSQLTQMIEYARLLAEGFPFVRVDFYQVEERIIFGELTFFHGAGTAWFKPETIDQDLGDKIVLPNKTKPWEIIKSIE